MRGVDSPMAITPRMPPVASSISSSRLSFLSLRPWAERPPGVAGGSERSGWAGTQA